MAFDIFFLLLITAAVPVVVFAGVKISGRKDLYGKLIVAFSIALLAAELVRFFTNAALYEGAITPKADLKFNFMTILTILGLFAAFNKKYSEGFRSVFVLLLLVPLVFAVIRPSCYVNELDAVNGVGKALYYLQAGFSFTLGILFLRGQDWSIRPLNIAWACLAVLLYAGVDALTIWYWDWNIAFDWVWYLTYAISLVSVAAAYAIVFLIRRLRKEASRPEN